MSAIRFFTGSLFIFLTLSVFSAPISSKAQTVPGLTPNADLVIDAAPAVPRPNQNVTLKATSFYLDLNRAVVGWYINDKLYKEGTGMSEITVQAGEAGTRTKIGVIAVDGAKKAIQYFFIGPASVDILWQAKTYTFPTYEGKAPYTNQSDILFHAIPNFPGYTTKDIIFTWSRNTERVDGGRGMDTILIPAKSVAEQHIVSVTAETADNKFSATKSIAFRPLFPEILVYQDNPITGFDFSREARLNGPWPTEFTLASFPFGFSTPSRFSNAVPMYWLVNGTAISDKNTQSAVFRKEGGGVADIIIRANATNKILQLASQRFRLNLQD